MIKCFDRKRPLNVCLIIAKRGLKKKIMIFMIFILLLLPIIIYCIFKILQALSKYIQEVRRNKEQESEKGLLHDKTNDNELYVKIPKKPDTYNDEYDAITKTIQNSFIEYQDYNKKLSNYHYDIKKQDPPNLMNHNVLKSDNDNW